MPALRTRKALQAAAPGQTLLVECTDPLAEIDIPHLLNQSGDELVGIKRYDDVSLFTILKR